MILDLLILHHLALPPSKKHFNSHFIVAVGDIYFELRNLIRISIGKILNMMNFVIVTYMMNCYESPSKAKS